jgi:hypothetical protein
MRTQKPFPRTLFFLFLLICLLGGLIGVAGVPVEAAPQMAAPLDVVINEIAWGATAGSTADEWIELYNPTASDIDLTGWTLVATSGTPSITLSGIIPANGYFLLERTDDTATSLPGDQFFSGAIANNPTGDSFTLRDQLNNIIDTANIDGGGWPGGSATPSFFSMERRGVSADADANWGSNNGIIINGTDVAGNPITGTPKQPNSIFLSAQVIINEVGWAGTRASIFDEWIELYNAGSTAVDLTNWRVQAADGDPLITLSGSLAPNGYLLLERGSQNVTNVPGTVYSSGLLGDTGETLYLLDGTSNVVDIANSNSGAWPAGGASPNFPTMERIGIVPDSDFVWLTFAGTPSALDAGNNPIYGTPGAANWALGQLPTPSPTITFTPTLTFTPTPTNTSTPPPTATPAGFLSVVINEIAWMGTLASTTDEWIELYNPGSTAINITGWTLKALDGTPTIVLNGIIPAGGYFILERSDDNTISDVTADQIYTGDLENSNEVLQLIDTSNRTIDTANANSGTWPAGSTSTYGSMERRGVVADSDTAWITNANPASWTKHDARGTSSTSYLIRGTPGYANWAISVTATPSPRPTATRTPIRTSTPAPPPPPPLVAINEFVPRPGSDWNGDGVINTGDEYIELLNHGVVPVNLSGYRLDDEVNIGSSPFALPSITLQPGERIVFYGSDTGLSAQRRRRRGPPAPTERDLDGRLQLLRGQPSRPGVLPPARQRRRGRLEHQLLPDARPAQLAERHRPAPADRDRFGHPLCPIADTLPEEFFLAECTPFGNNIWNRYYWDRFGWFGGKAPCCSWTANGKCMQIKRRMNLRI